MGTHFSVYVSTQPKGKSQNMGSLCSGLRNCDALHTSAKSRVQWFFIALRISSLHSMLLYESMQRIIHTHHKYLYIQTIKKVNNKCDNLVIWWWKNVHTVLYGVISPERLKRSGQVVLITANYFKWKTGNYSHENKRNGSKCKIIDLSAELKKVACWQRAPNNRLAK